MNSIILLDFIDIISFYSIWWFNNKINKSIFSHNSMNNKILFWISADLMTFCLAHYLQKSNIGKFYSITDITKKPKKFFEEQTFVNFSNDS